MFFYLLVEFKVESVSLKSAYCLAELVRSIFEYDI